MRSINLNEIDTYSKIKPSVNVPFNFLTGINFLIIIHILLFTFYKFFDANAVLSKSLIHDSVNHFAGKVLAISSSTNDLKSHWWSSIFTYQFIHFNVAELILSMSILWLFGHILKKRIGRSKVMLLYLLGVTFSAVIFILSHQLFPVFAGPNGVLEGAYGGAITVMTCTVTLYKSYGLKINDKVFIPLWKIYFVILLISFVLFYKNSISYMLVYLCSIYTGYTFANWIESAQTRAINL